MTVDPLGPTQLDQPSGEARHAKEMRFARAFWCRSSLVAAAEPDQAANLESPAKSGSFPSLCLDQTL
jgi:hypothetical protein